MPHSFITQQQAQLQIHFITIFRLQLGYNKLNNPKLPQMQTYRLHSQTYLNQPPSRHNPLDYFHDQSSQPPLKECRICLSHDVQNQNILISPCRCSGSIKYVHQSCLKNWLQFRLVQIDEEENCEKKVACELCKTDISFEIELRSELRNLSQLRDEVRVKNYQFAVNIICIIISICLIAFSTYKLQNLANDEYGDSQNAVRIVLLSILVVSVPAFIYSIYSLREFIIKKKAELVLRSANNAVDFGQIQ